MARGFAPALRVLCAVGLLACQESGETPQAGGTAASDGALPGDAGTVQGGSGSFSGGLGTDLAAAGNASSGSAGMNQGLGGNGVTGGGDAQLPGTGNEPGVAAPDCAALSPKVTAGVVENDQRCWFTFNMPWDDDSPNVTNMKHLLDAPAGKHGYLKVGTDGHFFFEDQPGTRARFNGVTFTAGANFPDKALAPGIAARMARFGINMVRVTFQDYIPPFGLFKEPLTNTRELDPAQLDKLDWFIHQLKLSGIYVHLDFLSARPFLEGDGVANYLPTLGQKVGSLFDPIIVELQREFIENLLNHVNPYTKLAYKSDPAIPLAILANENAIFLGWVAWMPDKAFAKPGCTDCLSVYYSSQLDGLYNGWLKGKYGTDAAIRAAWGTLPAGQSLADSSIARTPKANFGGTPPARIRDEARFYYDTEGKYLKQLRSYIRDTLGSRMLVTMTTQEFGVASVASQAQGDFLDNNIYWHHPSSLERTPGKYFGFYDAPVVSNMHDSQNFVARISQARVKGLPTIVSEFNYNFPNSYQMEAPGMMYAFLNYVGGDGVLWHSYYNFFARVDGSDLNDMFEVGNSPHLITQFLLAKPYLAGDLKEASVVAEVVHTEQDQWDTIWRVGSDKVITSDGPALTSLLQTPMVRSFFGNTNQVPASLVPPSDDFMTGNGELHWNNTKGFLTIKTPIGREPSASPSRTLS